MYLEVNRQLDESCPSGSVRNWTFDPEEVQPHSLDLNNLNLLLH